MTEYTATVTNKGGESIVAVVGTNLKKVKVAVTQKCKAGVRVVIRCDEGYKVCEYTLGGKWNAKF